MLSSFDSGVGVLGICGPVEGLWVGVGLVKEAIDRGLEVDEGAEDAAFEAPPGELGEEALDGVEPRRGSRGEVEGPARMPSQPCAHLGMLGTKIGSEWI